MMANGETADQSLSGLLDQALPHARPERLGHLILRGDPQFFRLTAEESEEVVRTALGLGVRYAEELVAEQGSRDPLALAARLGIKVVISDDRSRYGHVLQYAEYHSRPPQIQVYRKAMESINRLLEDPAIAELLGLSDVTPAFLAHELFHHLDNLPDRQPAKRVRQVVTMSLGPWRIRSGLIAAPEVAAGSFAQTLLPMPFHLKLFDLLAIFGESPIRAAEWARALARADDESRLTA